jgi:hypothetical protein
MPDNAGERIVPVPKEFAARAHIGSLEQYRALYERSLKDSDGYWTEQAAAALPRAPDRAP